MIEITCEVCSCSLEMPEPHVADSVRFALETLEQMGYRFDVEADEEQWCVVCEGCMNEFDEVTASKLPTECEL